jgi:hypothetical protein
VARRTGISGKILFGALLLCSSVWGLLLLKTLARHLLERMTVFGWRSDGLGELAFAVALLAMPVLGHGWAALKWKQRDYAGMSLAIVLAYAVPFTLFAIRADLGRLALERARVSDAAGLTTGR